MRRYHSHFRSLWLVVLIALLVSACSKNQEAGNKNAPVRTEPPAYEGYHDITNCNAITGWVWDSNHPEDSVKVEIYDGERLLATVTADNYRKDLLDAHKGNGK